MADKDRASRQAQKKHQDALKRGEKNRRRKAAAQSAASSSKKTLPAVSLARPAKPPQNSVIPLRRLSVPSAKPIVDGVSVQRAMKPVSGNRESLSPVIQQPTMREIPAPLAKRPDLTRRAKTEGGFWYPQGYLSFFHPKNWRLAAVTPSGTVETIPVSDSDADALLLGKEFEITSEVHPVAAPCANVALSGVKGRTLRSLLKDSCHFLTWAGKKLKYAFVWSIGRVKLGLANKVKEYKEDKPTFFGTIGAGQAVKWTSYALSFKFGIAAGLLTVPVGGAILPALVSAAAMGALTGATVNIVRTFLKTRHDEKREVYWWFKAGLFGFIGGAAGGALGGVTGRLMAKGLEAMGLDLRQTTTALFNKARPLALALYEEAKPIAHMLGEHTLSGLGKINLSLGAATGLIVSQFHRAARFVAQCSGGNDMLHKLVWKWRSGHVPQATSIGKLAALAGKDPVLPRPFEAAASGPSMMEAAKTLNDSIPLPAQPRPVADGYLLAQHGTPEVVSDPVAGSPTEMFKKADALADHVAPDTQKTFSAKMPAPPVEMIHVPKALTELMPQKVFDHLPEELRQAAKGFTSKTSEMQLLDWCEKSALYLLNEQKKVTRADHRAICLLWQKAAWLTGANGLVDTARGQRIATNYSWALRVLDKGDALHILKDKSTLDDTIMTHALLGDNPHNKSCSAWAKRMMAALPEAYGRIKPHMPNFRQMLKTGNPALTAS